MPTGPSSILVIAALALSTTWSLSAAETDSYRGFTLRDSTAAIIASTQAPERDIRTLHERPSRVQELTWRPSSLGRSNAERDSVSTIVFSFLDDQLFRMSVTYDAARTEGLTRQDLIESLSAVYGPRAMPLAPAPRRSAFESIESATPVAVWRAGDTMVTLNEMAYRGGFGLVVVSTALDTAARKAQAAAVTLDAREAPAREAAREKATASAARDAAEKTRTVNKGAFKP